MHSMLYTQNVMYSRKPAHGGSQLVSNPELEDLFMLVFLLGESMSPRA